MSDPSLEEDKIPPPPPEDGGSLKTKIFQDFNDTNISKKTIYLSTDLEPDDMMAIKLLAPKLQKCSKIYVVLGEHATNDITKKCKLFYILAKNYNFLKKIHSDNGKICIYKGYESHNDKEYPKTIFDYLDRETSVLSEYNDNTTTIVDLQVKEQSDKFNTELKDLKGSIIFLLMKPPKELFYFNGIIPKKERLKCTDSLAFMYGSFNINELNDFLLVKEQEQYYIKNKKCPYPMPKKPIQLSDIKEMFPKIVYIERKPEIALYNQTQKELDPNPFFGYLDDNITKVLEDDSLPNLMRQSYLKITENDPLLEYCTINWQLDALSGALKKLDLKQEFETYKKLENETEVQQLIKFFKSKFFKNNINVNSNMVESDEGYYAGIFDDEKIKKMSKTDDVKDIIKSQKKKAENKWGMMVGIVLADGKQTPLADQIIAALILDPTKFTLKEMKRDDAVMFTIVPTELEQSRKKVDDLKKLELNTEKIKLYKIILTIIKEQPQILVQPQEPQELSDIVHIGGYKKRTKKNNKKKNQKKTRLRRRSKQRTRRRPQYKSKIKKFL